MKYVAFLRGIGPNNPNMHGEKLRMFFQKLGFKQVQTVISSGNVIFDSDSTDHRALETKIEKALPETLGFSSTTIIRDHETLKRLFASHPFGNTPDTPKSRLNVTFLKSGGEVYTVIDPTDTGTPAIMQKLEKKHGKEITTRTWKTIARILKRLEQTNST